MTRIIPNFRFNDAFKLLGWNHSESKSGLYDIWTDPKVDENWNLVPKDEKGGDYLLNQDINIKSIVEFLEIDKIETNYQEIYSQLVSYTHKISNRIIKKEESGDDSSVPLEFTKDILVKNIESLKDTLYVKNKIIDISEINMGHTQSGSFLIPLTIPVIKLHNLFGGDEDSQSIQFISDYLNRLEYLNEIEVVNDINLADKLYGNGVTHTLAKQFFDPNKGIRKTIDKYRSTINGLKIGAKASPILNYKKKIEFKEVDLTSSRFLSKEVLTRLKDIENQDKQSSFQCYGVNLYAEVDGINKSGTGIFTIRGVDGYPDIKDIKAMSTKLSEARQVLCSESFRKKQLIISGDLIKSKGQIAELVVGDKMEISNNPVLL